MSLDTGYHRDWDICFVEHVLDTYNIDENPADRPTLINDNLTSHRAPEVYEAMRESGHCVVCCPLYQVCFNLTKRWSEVNDLETIQAVIDEIINNDITGMNKTFLHCGYIWN